MRRFKQALNHHLDIAIQKIQMQPIKKWHSLLVFMGYLVIVGCYFADRENVIARWLFIFMSLAIVLYGIWSLLLIKRYLAFKTEERFGTSKNRLEDYSSLFQFKTEDMGFEPTHAVTRLPRFQHGLLSLLSNLPMEPVGIEPTSKHLPTHSSTTIGYVLV